MNEEIESNVDAFSDEPENKPPSANRKGGTGKKVGLVILILLAIAGLTGAGILGYFWSDSQHRIVDLESEAIQLNGKIETLDGTRKNLEGQLADVRSELDRERSDRVKERKDMEAAMTEQLQRTYATFNEIVYDSQKVIEYIGSAEEKLKTGQKLDEQEAQELQSVVNGLTFLHEQYRKPIQEFRELERYLSEQLAVPKMVPPRERYGLFQRMFSKEYKADQAAFYKDEGQREAFGRARTKVSDAYARAQAQMKALAIDSGDYLDDLKAIMESNQASVDDIDNFFEKSKEILKIHERIMSIEPEPELMRVKP